jgi:hypothetical protein
MYKVVTAAISALKNEIINMITAYSRNALYLVSGSLRNHIKKAAAIKSKYAGLLYLNYHVCSKLIRYIYSK